MARSTKRKVKLHERFRLAKRQCPECGDTWRVLKLNESETTRYGTMRCATNGHVMTGEFATLAQSPRYRKGAR